MSAHLKEAVAVAVVSTAVAQFTGGTALAGGKTSRLATPDIPALMNKIDSTIGKPLDGALLFGPLGDHEVVDLNVIQTDPPAGPIDFAFVEIMDTRQKLEDGADEPLFWATFTNQGEVNKKGIDSAPRGWLIQSMSYNDSLSSPVFNKLVIDGNSSVTRYHNVWRGGHYVTEPAKPKAKEGVAATDEADNTVIDRVERVLNDVAKNQSVTPEQLGFKS